jgi:integrase
VTPTESNEVRRAFLFSCITGLRWIDVNALKWENINGKMMTVRQSKTGEDVGITLNDSAIKLLGEPGNGKVFDLPSANGANKTLKAWIKRAKINKAITWHNARHSFGTNLIFNDVDILTTSKLLGHTSMRHTMRYVDVARQMKETATDKLNLNL